MVSEKPEDMLFSSTIKLRPPIGLLPILSQLRRILTKVLLVLLMIFPRSLRPASNSKPHELHPTAYLDALRGYAAWIVYNSHIVPGGWRRESDPLMRWPFKIVFKGPAMVDVFFVISGFALSHSVLGYMHDKQPGKVLDSLASSVFRRHLRLYLPLICVSFVTMLAISTGIAVKGEDPQVLQPTFMGNLWYWVKDTVRSCDPFPHVVSWWFKGVRLTHTDYVPQAWTIPVEFRGSLVVFIFCVAVCRMTMKARMWTTLAAVVACFWWITPYAGLFLYGMWLADRRHMRVRRERDLAKTLPLSNNANDEEAAKDKEPLVEVTTVSGYTFQQHTRGWTTLLKLRQRLTSPTTRSSPLFQQAPYIILAILSLWPLTGPDPLGPSSPFPYNLMSYTIPPNWNSGRGQYHWPYAIGAMMLCYALERSPILQKPLNTQFSQFVGELSFGIYVMHNLVRWCVWERYIVEWGRMFFGSAPRWQLPGYFVMTVLVFWAAEGFRRMDGQCVRFTKWVQGRVFER